ncbi:MULTISPECIES: winged helix-turn-helix transcriptional regulator [unclassified Streptomyces]|uniref:winged helix-turn-helix transcriptional regulator n=1 Tax=unclassified Streptomyces TaxID=2593676 RepID=UPI00380501DB
MPPRVEYRLTPLGEGLREVLDAMAAEGLTVPEPARPSAWVKPPLRPRFRRRHHGGGCRRQLSVRRLAGRGA